MKRLIDAIINKWFCLHQWDFVTQTSKFRGDPTREEVTRVVAYTMVCKKCGKFKKISV